MADNRRFDTPVDTDGKAAVGKFIDYGNQFKHSESVPDAPIGTDPNAAGASKVFPDDRS